MTVVPDAHDEVLTRTRLRTSSPDEAREVLESMFGSQLHVDAGDDSEFRVAVDAVDVVGVTLAAIDLPMRLHFGIAGRDHFAFGDLIAGTTERSDGHRFGRGDVFLASTPGFEERCETDGAYSKTVQLPAALLDSVASTDPDGPVPDWRFLSRRPVHGGAARWNGVVGVYQRLVEEPQRASAPLVINAAVRLLAATALDVFPNTAVVQPDKSDAHDAQPSTVQRAVAFIEANPALDITVADIARAAYVSVRAVQLAFRRQLDTTPMAYLRRVRLSQAHEELRNATSGDHLTVTRVALKWGFSTPRRFAELYRAQYGCAPADTLQGWR